MSKLEKTVEQELFKIARNKKWSVYSCLDTYMDTKQGTDFIVNGIRIDVTGLSKDVIDLKCDYLAEYNKVYAHMKRSNGRFELEEPVIMISFDTSNPEFISEFFDSERFEEVQDAFFYKCDQLGIVI